MAMKIVVAGLGLAAGNEGRAPYSGSVGTAINGSSYPGISLSANLEFTQAATLEEGVAAALNTLVLYAAELQAAAQEAMERYAPPPVPPQR